MSHGCQLDSDFNPGFYHDICNEEHGSDSYELFDHLSRCRDMRALHTIIVTIDTGVNGRTGDGYRNKEKKRGTAGFHQDIDGQEILKPDDAYARIKEIATEIIRPVRKMERPFLTLAATDWDMAV